MHGEDRDLRRWVTFWSFTDKEGTRYRHQVRNNQARPGSKRPGPKDLWQVRTEIYAAYPPYYGKSIDVPEGHGRAMRLMALDWTNVEEGATLYPPEYKNGFLGLSDATTSNEPQLADPSGQCTAAVSEAHG